MPRTRIAAAALLGALALGSAGRAAETPDALVYDAIVAPRHVSFTGLVETTRIGRERSEVSIFTVEHRAPDFTVRAFSAPSSLLGDRSISRGTSVYSVDVKRKRIVENSNSELDDQIALDDNYILMRANYRAVAAPGERFDDRACRVISLVNRYTHKTVMLLRIDAATTLVLDKQLFGADGSLIEETRFTRVDFTKTPPAADFAVPQNMPAVNGPSRTKPSENVKAVVANAGFHASVPRVLPDGFSPVEGTVATIKGIRSLHVLFSDGLRTISLFENAQSSAIDLGRYHAQSATIGTTTGQYAEAGPDILLTWSKNGTHYTLVGSLPLDELERIAASM